MTFMQFWLSLTRNPLIVTAYSAAAGAVVSYLQGALSTGNFSFAIINWAQLGTLAATAAIMAVLHLYTPAPGSNPKP